MNFQDREGSTAMHLAASCGYLQSVKTLLELGADITLRNAIGQTPLEEAEQTGLEESDVCVDYLRTIWQNLEEEAAARMMTMLEMEEQSAASSKSAGATNNNANNHGGAVGGAAAASSSKKSKKKNKKQKRKAAAKQQAQSIGNGTVAGVDGSGASSLDGKIAGSNEPVSSGESSEEDEGEKLESLEVDEPAAALLAEASEIQGSEEQSDDSTALAGVWTTVGKKQPSKFSVAAAPDHVDAETVATAKETPSASVDGNVASTFGGRTSKSPTQSTYCNISCYHPVWELRLTICCSSSYRGCPVPTEAQAASL